MSNKNNSTLLRSNIIVDKTHLIIRNDKEKVIPLTEVTQLSIDGEIKYIQWFLILLIPASIILYAFGSSLPAVIKWLLLVIGGIWGLKILFGAPEREYLMINMKQADPFRVPINDKREDVLEFIRRTNVHIYSLNKNN
jgi:hypothetical protein